MMYAVVMAGGSGTRFWPLSRRALPKQFLAIGTERTLIEETVLRLEPAIPAERVYVLVGESHLPALRRVLPALTPERVVVEPCARSTAPCVGLAALHLLARDPDAVMAVLPADHHISDRATFQRLLAAAEERARAGEIVTIGIRPDRPETGYGYIHYAREDTLATSNGVDVCPVRRFVEKPPKSVAEHYLAEGGYLWNSGMFFFTARRILADIRRFLPHLAESLGRIGNAMGSPIYPEVLATEFAALESISLDYGVMEHADHVRVIPADIGWNDVGHWAALADYAEADPQGNVVSGRALLVDCREAIVRSAGGRLLTLLGVEDLVVVDTPDALLVCARDRVQEVRRVVTRLEELCQEDLL